MELKTKGEYKRIWYADLEAFVLDKLGATVDIQSGEYHNGSVIWCKIDEIPEEEYYSPGESFNIEELIEGPEELLYKLYWDGHLPAGNYAIDIWW